jgi:hypothetical protein
LLDISQCVTGFELKALHGATKVLSRDKPAIVMETIHDPDGKAVKYLESLGYVKVRHLPPNDYEFQHHSKQA